MKSSITPLDWLQIPAMKTATSTSRRMAPERFSVGMGLLLGGR